MASRLFIFALFLSLAIFSIQAVEEDLGADDHDHDHDHDHGHDHSGHDHHDHGEKKVDESDVLVLTAANFDAKIAEHEYILVEFYAPWCGHCKSLKGPYAAAATLAKSLNPPVVLGKVDATKEESLATKFSIEGFPTLKFFVKGEPIDFTGGRTAKDIVAWVKKRSGSPTEVIADAAEFDKYLEGHQVVVAGFFASRDGDLFTAFQKAAMKAQKPFAEGPADSASKHGLSVPSVAIFKKFDEGKAVYSGAANAEDILKFVQENGRPSVMEFREDLVEEMFHNELPKVFLFGTDESARKEFEAAAKVESIRGKVVMIIVPKTAEPNFFEFIGVPEDQEVALVIELDAITGKRYRLPTETAVTSDNIVAFHKDVIDGKVKAHIKSAPPPKTNNGPVIEVVGSTFADLVLNNDKSVIVEFYAPWCGHCQSLAPIYDKVAAHFRETNPDDLIIAKIDGTANEIETPELAVEGFPTIFAFPKGSKNTPIDISSKPRKNAKQLINTISKVFNLQSARPGEDIYRDAVSRLKTVLKQKPTLLQFVADELQRVAKEAEAKVAAKDEL